MHIKGDLGIRAASILPLSQHVRFARYPDPIVCMLWNTKFFKGNPLPVTSWSLSVMVTRPFTYICKGVFASRSVQNSHAGGHASFASNSRPITLQHEWAGKLFLGLSNSTQLLVGQSYRGNFVCMI